MSTVLRWLALTIGLAAAGAWAQFPLPIDTTRTIDAGLDHNLAIIPSGPNAGQVWAWGGNAGGKLGNGSFVNASMPVRVGKNTAGFTSLAAVAASQANSYAIDSAGTLWAWGDDRHSGIAGSRLGIGDTPSPSLDSCFQNGSSFPCSKTPRKVPIPGTPGAGGTPTRKVVQVGAGWGHVVALLDNGEVWTFGDNGNGAQLGQGTSTGGSSLPIRVKDSAGTGFLGNIVEVAVGYFHTVARTNTGTLVAWGLNNDGQLGRGNTTNSTLPVAVSVLTSVSSIRSKGNFNLALKSDGTVWAWGSNRYGQLGIGPPGTAALSNAVATPAQVHGQNDSGFLVGVDRIAAGYTTAFARTTTGTVVAWGLDQQPDPQLGVAPGSTNNQCSNGVACRRFPTALPAAYNNAQQISAGGAHAMILKSDNTLGLFGNNASGQLASTTAGGGTFGNLFLQSSTWDPDFAITPQALGGSGSSVGAQARIGGLTLIGLGAGIDFGQQLLASNNDRLVTFENLDVVATTITGINVGASGFSNIGPNCVNVSVPSNNSCSFSLRFSPSNTGDYNGALTIDMLKSGESWTLEAVLVGTGVTAPDPPTGVSAAPGNGQASVSFNPPSFTGGATIEDYTATSSPGGLTATATGSPITVTGLANGTSYTFSVRARNVVGPSAPSTPSNAVVPQATTYALNVAIAGGGSGTVTTNPAAIFCPGTCSANFAAGSAITVIATPAGGSVFAGWSGDCSGMTCAGSMNAPASVTANFALQPARTATDFNGDGRSDVLWRNGQTGQVYRMFMNGFSITSGAMAYTEPDTAWKVVADADFNGDGITDLLWRHATTGQVALMPFSASGLPNGGSVVYTEPNAAWKIVQTPDINGDGKADIVWWNSTTGQVYVMLMNGASILAAGMVYQEPNTHWQIVSSGDYAGSGKRNQLLWRNDQTAEIYQMTIGYNGSFSVSGALIYTAILPYKIVASADFNGDGKTDILWRNDQTGQVYLMLMNGTARLQEGQIYQEPNLAWKIVGAGDYNGDGNADILWRNDQTGQVYMMLMSGMSIANAAMIYQEPNTAWKVLGPWEYSQTQ